MFILWDGLSTSIHKEQNKKAHLGHVLTEEKRVAIVKLRHFGLTTSTYT